jgi:hypothetical protein
MTTPKSPRLIPAPGEPITDEQAIVLLDHYGEDAGEMAAAVAATLRDKGRVVHFWKVLTADEVVRSWDPGASIAIVALTHYAPSQGVSFDAVQVRRCRASPA